MTSVEEVLRARIAELEAQIAGPAADAPLVVGQVLHGYCGGIFGRDHYDCSRVEAIGPDWVVVRDDEGYPGFASGVERLAKLRAYRAEGDHCPARPCPVQPREA